jgi:hypothetical protein
VLTAGRLGPLTAYAIVEPSDILEGARVGDADAACRGTKRIVEGDLAGVIVACLLLSLAEYVNGCEFAILPC